jgi:hypothetical protein
MLGNRIRVFKAVASASNVVTADISTGFQSYKNYLGVIRARGGAFGRRVGRGVARL